MYFLFSLFFSFVDKSANIFLSSTLRHSLSNLSFLAVNQEVKPLQPLQIQTENKSSKKSKTSNATPKASKKRSSQQEKKAKKDVKEIKEEEVKDVKEEVNEVKSIEISVETQTCEPVITILNKSESPKIMKPVVSKLRSKILAKKKIQEAKHFLEDSSDEEIPIKILEKIEDPPVDPVLDRVDSSKDNKRGQRGIFFFQ